MRNRTRSNHQSKTLITPSARITNNDRIAQNAELFPLLTFHDLMISRGLYHLYPACVMPKLIASCL